MKLNVIAGYLNLISINKLGIKGYGDLTGADHFNCDIVAGLCANPIGTVCYLQGNNLVNRTDILIHFRVCSVSVCGHRVSVDHCIGPRSAKEIGAAADNIPCRSRIGRIILRSSNADSGDRNRCYDEH